MKFLLVVSALVLLAALGGVLWAKAQMRESAPVVRADDSLDPVRIQRATMALAVIVEAQRPTSTLDSEARIALLSGTTWNAADLQVLDLRFSSELVAKSLAALAPGADRQRGASETRESREYREYVRTREEVVRLLRAGDPDAARAALHASVQPPAGGPSGDK